MALRKYDDKEREELEKEIEEIQDEINKKRGSIKDEEAKEDSKKVATQVIEREITLSLINDKLNYIISKIEGLK